MDLDKSSSSSSGLESKLKTLIKTINTSYLEEESLLKLEDSVLTGSTKIVEDILGPAIVDSTFPAYTERLYSVDKQERLREHVAQLLRHHCGVRSSTAAIYNIFFEGLLLQETSSPINTKSLEGGYVAAVLLILAKCLEEVHTQNNESTRKLMDIPKALVSSQDEWNKFLSGGVAYIQLYKTYCSNIGAHPYSDSTPPAAGVSLLTEQALCASCLAVERVSYEKLQK